jgi:hypothetical protein
MAIVGTTHPLRKPPVPPPPDPPIANPDEPAPILQPLIHYCSERCLLLQSFWTYPNWNGFYRLLDSRRDSFLFCQPMINHMPMDMRYCRICDMWKRIESDRERRKNNKTRRDHLGLGPRKMGDDYDVSEACSNCLEAYCKHVSQGHDIRECDHRLYPVLFGSSEAVLSSRADRANCWSLVRRVEAFIYAYEYVSRC